MKQPGPQCHLLCHHMLWVIFAVCLEFSNKPMAMCFSWVWVVVDVVVLPGLPPLWQDMTSMRYVCLFHKPLSVPYLTVLFSPQIEMTKSFGVTEWRDSLRILLRRAGAEGRQMVFLFSDTQVADESFLEDINLLLNTGDIPNLYNAEDKSAILDDVRKIAEKQVWFKLWQILLLKSECNFASI